MKQLDPEDAWRGILLFGQNTATYKVALAECLGVVHEYGVASSRG